MNHYILNCNTGHRPVEQVAKSYGPAFSTAALRHGLYHETGVGLGSLSAEELIELFDRVDREGPFSLYNSIREGIEGSEPGEDPS
jgi:hypothetical protein